MAGQMSVADFLVSGTVGSTFAFVGLYVAAFVTIFLVTYLWQTYVSPLSPRNRGSKSSDDIELASLWTIETDNTEQLMPPPPAYVAGSMPPPPAYTAGSIPNGQANDGLLAPQVIPPHQSPTSQLANQLTETSNGGGHIQDDGGTISAEDFQRYDRQIRLWGSNAQKKLRTSKVLIIRIKGLSNEIAKNLVLTGIGSLTLQDDQTVVDDDLGAQFAISEQDVGKNRAQAAAPYIQKLNPKVSVRVDTEDIKMRNQDYYAQFDMIIATDLDLATLFTINSACRMCNRPFYAAGTHGFYGYIFADLISHDYVIEREKSNRPTIFVNETLTRSIISTSTKHENGKEIEMVTKREIYSPINLANSSPLPVDQISSRRKKLQVPPLLSCLRALWEFESTIGSLPSHTHNDLALFTTLATQKHGELTLPTETLNSEFLRSFLQQIGSEIAPVTAVLGGQLAQEVVNVLSQREQPIQNFLLFDAEADKGPILALHPIFTSLPPINEAPIPVQAPGLAVM